MKPGNNKINLHRGGESGSGVLSAVSFLCHYIKTNFKVAKTLTKKKLAVFSSNTVCSEIQGIKCLTKSLHSS